MPSWNRSIGARVYTHFAVREDAQVLYGFASKAEREIFRLLLSVSGVGGNTARMILSTYSPAELANIITTENAVLLKNVKGLGLKTARRSSSSSRTRRPSSTASPRQLPLPRQHPLPDSEIHEEAVAALTMLGFGKAASDKAVKTILQESPSLGVEEVIRQALKRL